MHFFIFLPPSRLQSLACFQILILHSLMFNTPTTFIYISLRQLLLYFYYNYTLQPTCVNLLTKKFFQYIPVELCIIDNQYFLSFIHIFCFLYISCITVYFYTYKHLHHPITSALYTTYHRRIMPIRMHSRLVFDFHNYLIYLFLCTRISIFP